MYVSALMKKGLLCSAWRESMRRGDGERLIAHWKYFFPQMKRNGHRNYALLHFDMVAKLGTKLTERQAHEAVHNRCINMNVGQAKTHQMTL